MPSDETSSAEEEARLLEALGADNRRAMGCYLTPQPLAALMCHRAAPLLARTRGSARVLDPAAGTGRLLLAMQARGAVLDEPPTLFGVERDPRLAAFAARRLPGPRGQVFHADALDWLEPSRRPTGASEPFDLILANPPYLGEKGNAAVFRALRERSPGWRPLMRPRQDLQQLFVLLALELLRPGGELVFLMNGYWLTSDAGAVVREHLRAKADLIELVDFGSARLFTDAPGQHGLLLHARKRREGGCVAPTTFVAVAPSAPTSVPALVAALDDPASAWVERRQGAVAVSGPSRRWYAPSAEDETLARLERTGVPLGEVFETHQGVVSGADRVTARNLRAVGASARKGDGIFLLSDEEVEALALGDEERVHLRRVVRARQIAPFEVAPATISLIYATDALPLERLPNLARHLRRFEALLSARREARAGKMPWFRLHWPRTPGLFDRPRIITPRRSTSPRFALGLPGHCEQSDIALITTADDDEERLAALLVVLNSAVVASWCLRRGKQKGTVREYFGRALEEIPLPLSARADAAAFRALAAYADGGRRDEAEAAVRDAYGLR